MCVWMHIINARKVDGKFTSQSLTNDSLPYVCVCMYNYAYKHVAKQKKILQTEISR